MTRKGMALLFVAVFAVGCFAGKEDWATNLFVAGNQAYENGQYSEAEKRYRKIVENGIENPLVLYNLGNALFRQNKIGLAILAYEKSQKLSPKDEDVKSNLRFLRANLVDKLPEPRAGLFGMVLAKAHGLLSLHSATLLAFGLYVLLCIVVIAGVYAGYNGRLVCIYIGSVLLVLLLLTGTSLVAKIHAHEVVRHAVVLSQKVDALNEPDGTQTLFTVHEGAKFQIRKEMGEWVLVSLPNGMTGWVALDQLGRI